MLPDHSKVFFQNFLQYVNYYRQLSQYLLQNSFKIDPECLYPVNKAMFTSRFGKKSRWPNIKRNFLLFNDLHNFIEMSEETFWIT